MRGDTKEKILLLLLSGLVMSLSKSPKGYYKILNDLPRQLKEVRRKRLHDIVREFYNDRIVDYKEDKDGFTRIVLTKEGQKKALKFKIDEIEIKVPAKWDGKWRIVIFDIPEKFKKAREALRRKLKDLGFLELQKSVFRLGLVFFLFAVLIFQGL